MNKKRMVFALLDEIASHFAQLQDAVFVRPIAALKDSVASSTFFSWCSAVTPPRFCSASKTSRSSSR